MPTPSRRTVSRAVARAPVKPRQPASLDLATVEDHDLVDEATYRRVGFHDIELPGREADSVEFEQCSFRRADLSGSRLTGLTLTDCRVQQSNLANLRTDKSGLVRVELS